MDLNIKDFTYVLPDDRIALRPLPKRDDAKLLVYRHGEIIHTGFRDLTAFLPEHTFLYFNDTKVIPARLHFTKDTGAIIEVFLLHPLKPSPLVAEAMTNTTHVTWKCTIGNLKRWKEGQQLILQTGDFVLDATLSDSREGIVDFSWTTGQSFAEIITRCGETPLPPYLRREAEADDRERYQTIYSHHEGAVAAPTAGLHFTPAVFDALQQKNISHDYLTLHVSAGTFQPVKTERVSDHAMHREQVVITRKNLENLLVPNRFIIAVGTTSLRTLESLYWFGARLIRNPTASFNIQQDEPYGGDENLPKKEDAIRAVMSFLDQSGQETLHGETSIFIMPGYTFRICNGLITNFHQPGSTLMLLVAAMAGEGWKRIYDEALNGDYRFLSYGDSSLILP